MSDRQPPRAKVTGMARLRDEHVGETRQALLTAARARFGRLGFAATSLDDVVADAGVTKGALYHHFKNKEHLFVEVYDQLEAELSAKGGETAAGLAGKGAVELLQAAFGSFLDLAPFDPEIRRISLVDARSVLGVEQKLEIDQRHALAGVRMVVEAGIAAGHLAEFDADALAQMLIAACEQAAVVIANAPEPTAARVEVGAALDHLIAGLAADR
jgi:AcrR family transcriptional regulator